MQKHIRTYGRLRCRSVDTSIMNDSSHLYTTINSIDNNNLTLEIGFGNGEVLLHRALKHKDQIHIGVEVYQNGICKVLKKIDANNITNIKIFPIDVRDFWLLIPNNITFHEIYVLYPDPWHKKSLTKQEKKRLVNRDFIHHISSLLCNNGSFFFASDHFDYYTNIKQYILENPNLCIIKETINEHLNDNFVISNYEKKAVNDCYYIQIQKKIIE